MEALVIEGGLPLKGTVQVNGAKNAVLPMMCAALLTRERVVIHNVPMLKDIETMAQILAALGVRVEFEGNSVILQTIDETNCLAPYELVRKMRASFCVLGPLVARRGRAIVAHPGGCVIGVRPVDLHERGFERLNIKLERRDGNLVASTNLIRGNTVYLGGHYGTTVTGTANLAMCAVLAKGTTVLEFAACEPEVQQLCQMLVQMGAKISGIGSPRLVIEGVQELHGVEIEAIPDRIETGTFMIAGAITGGDIVLRHTQPEHLTAAIEELRKIGVMVSCGADWIHVRSSGAFSPTEIVTHPYPGFPTDLQPQILSLLSITPGISVVRERVFPDRFLHIGELLRMGAKIRKEGDMALVFGVDCLTGAPVESTDIRAGAALIIAGLAAKGRTVVDRASEHVDRGYEAIEQRLEKLGARVRRVQSHEARLRA